MQLALGKAGARKMETFLRTERFINLARQIGGNSTTVRQAIRAGIIKTGGFGAAGGAGALAGAGFAGEGDPTVPILGGLLALGVRGGAGRLQTRINRKVADEIAELLVSTDPNMVQKGLQRLSNHRKLFPGLRKIDDWVARVFGQHSERFAKGVSELITQEDSF